MVVRMEGILLRAIRSSLSALYLQNGTSSSYSTASTALIATLTTTSSRKNLLTIFVVAGISIP